MNFKVGELPISSRDIAGKLYQKNIKEPHKVVPLPNAKTAVLFPNEKLQILFSVVVDFARWCAVSKGNLLVASTVL